MTARYMVGDVFDGLATLEDGSVDLVVTSPPFLALRSYLPADHPLKHKEMGSEASPSEFLDSLLRVVAECRRVLASHGSLCVELGDTYAGSSMDGGDQRRLENGEHVQLNAWSGSQPIQRRGESLRGSRPKEGWPLAKSAALIPEVFRFALAYGFNPFTGTESPAGKWRIRNKVTWARPNPPVGALGDKWRPATSDLVVACTSGKRYWDDLATRKPYSERFLDGIANGDKRGPLAAAGPDVAMKSFPKEMSTTHAGAPLLDYWVIPPGEPVDPKVGEQDRSDPHLLNNGGHMGTSEHGAPMLDYWVIPPGGYSGSHYAVFPPTLVEPLIKAMCPQRVCVVCGEPSRRIVETEYEPHGDPSKHNSEPKARADYALQQRTENAQGMANGRASRIDTTVGWSDCGHDQWRPGLVLDPFAGSGTTLMVATGHGHDAIGVDLDERNAILAEDRIGPFLFERVDLTESVS